MKLYIYQPGNGTRYEFYVEQINDPSVANALYISPGGWFVAWVNRGCRAFQPTGWLVTEYVMKHFKVNEADGEAITQFLGHIMDRKVTNPWPKCDGCGSPIDPANPYNKQLGKCVTCEYTN